MQSYIKTLSIFIFTSFIFCLAGGIYYVHASSFDNKSQYKSALESFQKQNYQEAYVGFLKIKIFSKYHRAALFKQITSAERLGDWSVVESKCTIFLKLYKNTIFSAKAEYLLAKSFYMNKKYDNAIKLFQKIRENSTIQDYRYASDYFLGKIAMVNYDYSLAKKYYFEYLQKAQFGTYSLSIAYDIKDMVLTDKEAVMLSKIFLANQKFDETLIVLKDIPKDKTWTYLAMAYYYKHDYTGFKNLVDKGFSSMSSGIVQEDLRDFTNFYLSIQPDYKKSLEELNQTDLHNVIPDFFLYKLSQFLPKNQKIKQYKEIIKKFPKSQYIPDCLVEIFFDFIDQDKYFSAIKIGNIFLEKFPENPQCSQILFWTAKYLLKVDKPLQSKQLISKLTDKYPDSYYSFRASRINSPDNLSWVFSNTPLPDFNNYRLDFPYEEVDKNDAQFLKLFFELGDTNVLEEIPLDNLAIKSWCEFKKGNRAKSIYLANKYIKESKKKIPYDNVVWKLAFPIYYSEYINENAIKYDLDPFLILSLIREESFFIEDARSTSNALGLMQLMMPTAIYIAKISKMQLPDDLNIKDSKYNISLGTAYFSYVLKQTDNNPMYAVGGYNGGPNAMNRWREKYKFRDSDEFVEQIPYPESKNYIKKVFRSRYNYAKIYGSF